jgi:hypothetical protein
MIIELHFLGTMTSLTVWALSPLLIKQNTLFHMGAQKRGITLHDIFNMTERRIMTFGCTEKSERHQEK